MFDLLIIEISDNARRKGRRGNRGKGGKEGGRQEEENDVGIKEGRNKKQVSKQMRAFANQKHFPTKTFLKPDQSIYTKKA